MRRRSVPLQYLISNYPLYPLLPAYSRTRLWATSPWRLAVRKVHRISIVPVCRNVPLLPSGEISKPSCGPSTGSWNRKDSARGRTSWSKYLSTYHLPYPHTYPKINCSNSSASISHRSDRLACIERALTHRRALIAWHWQWCGTNVRWVLSYRIEGGLTTPSPFCVTQKLKFCDEI